MAESAKHPIVALSAKESPRAWLGALCYLSISMIRNHLALTNRYIAEMKADIARERVIVDYALDAGYPSEVAESMLHALERALCIFEKHRQLVLDQLKRGSANFDDAGYTIGRNF